MIEDLSLKEINISKYFQRQKIDNNYNKKCSTCTYYDEG